MAIVKHPHEASAVTLESKHQRYDRLRRLFGIRRLGDLFPPGSTPNGAAHDPAYCSGDVLRDLCQIGEYLKNKGVGRGERCERVRKEFRAGEIVQHREIRELLSRVKKNEFEERLKNMMKKEPGLLGEEEEEEEEEDTKMNLQITNIENHVGEDPFFQTGNSAAVAITDKQTYVNAFMPHAQTAIQRMAESEDIEEVKYADMPGFATADQIRASFLGRTKGNESPSKRKRDTSVVVIKEEPVSASSTQEHDFNRDQKNHTIDTTPKRHRLSVAGKDALMSYSTRRSRQGNHTVSDTFAGRRMGLVGKTALMRNDTIEDNDDETTGKLKKTTELIYNLDIMIGNAQKKLGHDIRGADILLSAAKKLIREGLGREVGDGASLALMEASGSALGESTGPIFHRGGAGRAYSRAERGAEMERDSSEDGV
ncbi:Condensin complex subunit 2 [Venturia nashicola]|nr:Condensin complex subunit 2 [Venturia nashicola]